MVFSLAEDADAGCVVLCYSYESILKQLDNMKKTILSLLAFCALSVSAQNEIVVGDMNDDGDLTVSDVTALTETIVGRQAVRRISVAGDPYAADNTSIVGLWTGVSGTITFNADGTTDYKSGYRYTYLPSQCLVIFYDQTDAVVESLEVILLKSNELVLSDVSMTHYQTYGDHAYVSENGDVYYKDPEGNVYYKAEDGSIYYKDAEGYVYYKTEDGNCYYKDAEGRCYVDLGLPSGTLWATCNIGADSPEDRGFYFSWGEVKPKSVYYWYTYKYCKGTTSSMTKYCTSSDYGTVDNITELDPEDDAAYVNWGSDWRMPSYEQILELWNPDNTTIVRTTLNGVNGTLVTSNINGSYIFMHPAGYYDLTTLTAPDADGGYWTRSLVDNDSCFLAIGFNINNTTDARFHYRRSTGRPVRPVRVSTSK